jgi:glutamyl-Q tRNA(Asp) synthetase
MGVLYPCFCTRREIAAEIGRSGAAPQGEARPPYPGICRGLSAAERAARRAAGRDHALRLDLVRAVALTGPLDWVEEGGGEPRRVQADSAPFGDVVLARKDTPASYHLAVTLDDAVQGVTLVTRGADLAPATDVHRILQALLGLPTPRYRHHPLLTDAAGRRLAKRDGAPTIRAMRRAGSSPADIVGMVQSIGR